MRLPLIPLVPLFLALSLAAGCHGPFIDNPNAFRDHSGRNQQAIYTLDKASIRTADGRSLDIGRVVMNDNGRYLGSDSRDGLTAVDQNRVGLDAVPIIGGLFTPRLHESDFREAQRIGTLYAGDDTVYVVPDIVLPPRTVWKRAVLLNGNFAWVFPALMPVGRPTIDGAGQPVGEAYLRGDGETLLLLVRPSIVTDSMLGM